jgi:hypothetical protein
MHSSRFCCVHKHAKHEANLVSTPEQAECCTSSYGAAATKLHVRLYQAQCCGQQQLTSIADMLAALHTLKYTKEKGLRRINWNVFCLIYTAHQGLQYI